MPRFHEKKSKKNPPNFFFNSKKKIPKKKFQKSKSYYALCLNSYACNRRSACENFGGLRPSNLGGVGK
jgi:hypothetical protein